MDAAESSGFRLRRGVPVDPRHDSSIALAQGGVAWLVKVAAQAGRGGRGGLSSAGMGYEVELKFRGADHDDLARRLAAIGAEPGPTVAQSDAYLAHPSRDFAVTNEALRLRTEGTANKITYKGPKLGGPAKTREEVEIGYEPGAESLEGMGRIFEALGFKPVAVVRKSRRPFRLNYRGREVEVGLDRAEGLGDFAEVEALAEGPDDLAAAQEAVIALAAELGLAQDQFETRSYLRMVLQRQAAAGPPGP